MRVIGHNWKAGVPRADQRAAGTTRVIPVSSGSQSVTDRARPVSRPTDRSATQSVSWTAGKDAKLTAPSAAGISARAVTAATIPTPTARKKDAAGVRRWANIPNPIPHTSIQATCAAMPVRDGIRGGRPVSPKPCRTWRPSEKNAPDQSLCLNPNPVIAPAVAAAATRPARTPTLSRGEVTRE